MKVIEFYEQIGSLPSKHENRDLEEYLLALYALVEKHKEREITAELLMRLLSEAFTAPPAPFREEWLAYDKVPHDNGIIRKFTNPDLKDDFDRTFYTHSEGVEFTLEVLKFQIAELHKMRGKQLIDKYRYFGIDSETGHRWYNFDPFTNLECGVRCLDDNSDSDDEEIEIGWHTLGVLLEDGRIYE
ncbi:MAG: hypothetical protein LBV72_01605 [Tannerella sp.]|jgi:hypothetical protein|nr:hypothetical protein [Tannerella sp.]